VGYGREFDKWRLQEEVVNIDDDCDDEENSDMADYHFTGPIPAQFEELAQRIKSLLTSSKKGDPNCCIIMQFDQVSFDSLSLQCSLVKASAKRKIYRVPNLMKLNDLLGERWFIRGLNISGDFCYIVRDTIKLYMKKATGKPDYQWLDNGTMVKNFLEHNINLYFLLLRETVLPPNGVALYRAALDVHSKKFHACTHTYVIYCNEYIQQKSLHVLMKQVHYNTSLRVMM